MTSLEDFFAPPSPDDVLHADLMAMIKTRHHATPRHRQVALGPSEIGHPCLRKLAYGLMDAPPCNPYYDPLPSIFGVAMHTWLETAATLANTELQRDRWLTEQKVEVAPGLTGHADLYDVDTNTVIDWKPINVDTPVPTPSGWTTMGALRAGDQVLDINGSPTNVTAISPIWQRDCARIVFEDGLDIICSTDHEWVVQFGQDAITRTMTTSEMAMKLRCPKGQSQIRIVNTAPLILPNSRLPIEPYLLGTWLGDGDRNSGRIRKPDQELFDNIIKAGNNVVQNKPRPDGLLSGRIVGLTTTLRHANFLGNKHIPSNYLRASHEQRLSLLQGLMDTDGSWNKIRNQAVFSNNDKRLIYQVAELISTLGWKPRIWELQKTGFGKTITSYDITFIPFGRNPFRLTRKAELVRLNGTTRSRKRFIKSIERTLTVPTRCITVDSPTQTFLCTDAMIPTHNCPGKNRFDTYRRKMSVVYRAQGHLYGKGFVRAGYPVKRIAICMLPRGGSLASMHLWAEDYDESIADAVLAQRTAVIAMLNDFDIESHPERYEWFAKSPLDCLFCSWFSPRPDGPYQCQGDQ